MGEPEAIPGAVQGWLDTCRFAECGDGFPRAARLLAHEAENLGLAVSDGVVRAVGGELRIESALGIGTTVTITLPGGSS
jgi:K+-sensing histidine kinase KdpD